MKTKLKSVLTKDKLIKAGAVIVLTTVIAFAGYGIVIGGKALCDEFKAN